TRHVDHELRHGDDLDVRQVVERVADHVLALFEREQAGVLLRVADRGHQHPVEQVGSGLHELAVPVVERVERSRIEDGRHSLPFLHEPFTRWTMATTVPPYLLARRTRHGAGTGTSRSDSMTAMSASRAPSRRDQASSSNAYGGSSRARST